MRVAVLGGTGHISGSLVNYLLRDGHEVSCFHRNHTDELPDQVEQVLGDRKDREVFETAALEHAFDAAIDMISFDAEDAASSLRAFAGVRHFIQCSTVCTYGLPQGYFPITEEQACFPLSDYGKNKLAADELLLGAYRDHAFPLTIVKPSTTYGPKMGLLRQIAWDFTWINRMREGKGIVHCADGMAIHQFMYVDDCARAIASLLGREESVGEIYNIVPERSWTWKEHALTTMEVLGVEVPLYSASFEQLQSAQIEGFGICEEIFAHHTFYSSAKLRKLLKDFEDQYDLAAGIQATIAGMEARSALPMASENTWEDQLITSLGFQ